MRRFKPESFGPAMLPEPSCPHFKGGVCAWASELSGKMVVADGPLCQHFCRNGGGPFKGAAPTRGKSQGAVLIRAMCRQYPNRLIRKVYGRLGNDVTLGIPPVWPAIKEAFAPILALPFIGGIRLTGSLIESGRTTWKDYDVVVVVTSWGAAFADGGEWRNLIPKDIGGVPVDCHVNGGGNDFFPEVDPETRTLYIPPPMWATPPRAAPGIAEVNAVTPMHRRHNDGTPAGRELREHYLRRVHLGVYGGDQGCKGCGGGEQA